MHLKVETAAKGGSDRTRQSEAQRAGGAGGSTQRMLFDVLNFEQHVSNKMDA